MKAALVLIGLSLSAVASAQVRTVQTPASPPQTFAGNIRTEDPQIALLKKQVAEIKQQLSDVQQKNAELSYCLHELKKDLDEMKHPNSYDDAVVVASPKSIYATECN